MLIFIKTIFFNRKFTGLAIYPFIFLTDKKLAYDKRLINHEKIHHRQQIELLWIFFFLWYGIEFLVRLVQYRNGNLAYRNISFEREAYACDKDLNYLKIRKAWSFLKYLKQKEPKESQ